MITLSIPAAAMLALLLSSCGGLHYTPPLLVANPPNSAVIDQPREIFWRAFVPALSSQFFIINNLDKDTGLINLSYGGEPQQYIDCGQLLTKTIWGATDEFPVALPERRYNFVTGYGGYWAIRQLNLDGRMNIIVREVDPQKSSVTVNVRYVVNRRMTVGSGGQQLGYVADSVAFNYGEYGNFPDPHAFSCRSNGALEKNILEIAKSAATAK